MRWLHIDTNVRSLRIERWSKLRGAVKGMSAALYWQRMATPASVGFADRLPHVADELPQDAGWPNGRRLILSRAGRKQALVIELWSG